MSNKFIKDDMVTPILFFRGYGLFAFKRSRCVSDWFGFNLVEDLVILTRQNTYFFWVEKI